MTEPTPTPDPMATTLMQRIEATLVTDDELRETLQRIEATLVTDDELRETLQRIEAKLDTIFDVLTADEDEEIQLTLDDKDTRREGEQGKGLG